MNYTKKEIRDFEIMKQNQIGKKNEQIELEHPADIVVINNITRVCESKCVWVDIHDKNRLKRLIAREGAGYSGDYSVIAVKARTISFGDIIKVEQEIKI